MNIIKNNEQLKNQQIEFNKLLDELFKLGDNINNIPWHEQHKRDFQNLSSEEKELNGRQIDAMNIYYKCLVERIQQFKFKL